MIIPKIELLNRNTIREKYISIHFPEFYEYIIKHYPIDLSWTEKLYWYYNNLTERPICIVCGNPVRFINIKEGYKQYCSKWCSYKSDAMKEKKRQTCLERYGVDNPTKNREFVEKSMETQRKRYGGVGFESKELMDKTKKTNIERYGYEYAFQNAEIQKKQRQTNLERYGVEQTFASESVKEKIKQTNLERYGVENPGWIEESQKKIHKTNLERYGYEYAFQNAEIQKKQRQTNLKRYGADNPFASKECKEKIKKTLIEKYGVDHPLKSNEIKKRVEDTMIKRYGVKCYTQTDEYKIKEYFTKKANHSFNTSKIEESFSIWLTENNINFIRQYRSEEYPFACDFYFPDKDLYLEIQGTWTHGHHPFDLNNEDDLKILESWKEKNTKFYNNAIDVWTKSDPLKREIAKENNLNWVEVFSDDLNVLIEKFNDYY